MSKVGPVEVLLAGALAAIVLVIVVLLLMPTVHHVGDTRYCTGTGVALAGGKPGVVVVTIPCGTYQAGDPDVTP